MSKKKKGKVIPLQPISIERYVKERARSLPFGKCYEIAISQATVSEVVVSRVRKNGTHIFAFFLVDKGCLGVKDTFIQEYDDLDDFLETMSKFDHFDEYGKEIEAVYAQNLIYGAIEWAEDAGIKEHKYFETTQYMLEDVEDLEYVEIEFGLEGKHCYYQNDESSESKKIIKTLEKNLGEGNFTVISTNLFGDEGYDEDSVLPDALQGTFYEKYAEDVEALDDDLEIDENLASILGNVKEEHGEIIFSMLSLYCIFGIDFQIQLENDPALKIEFVSKPEETAGKMTSTFLQRHRDSLRSKGFTTDILEFLPLEAIIYNTILFESYRWLFLPDVVQAIAFKIQDEGDDDEVLYSHYTAFLAPIKERIAFQLNMSAAFFSLSEDMPNESVKEYFWDKMILKIFDQYPDFEMEDDYNPILSHCLSELEEINAFYPIPEGKEMLKWMKENGHHPEVGHMI